VLDGHTGTLPVSAPPMCISTSYRRAQHLAPVRRTAVTLSAQIAADTSAFFTAKVRRAAAGLGVGRSARSRPRTAQQPKRGVADAKHAQRMTARVVRHRAGIGAHVGHPEHVGQEQESS